MRQIIQEYTLRSVRFVSGEHFPLILDKSGMPLAWPASYLTTSRSQALNTIEDKARTLAMVHNFLHAYHIDLRERLRGGQLFEPWEIEGLSDHLRSIGPRTQSIRSRLQLNNKNYRSSQTVGSLEWHRRRIRAFRYLEWLKDQIVSSLKLSSELYRRVEIEMGKLEIGLISRKPRESPVPPALSIEEGLVLLDTIRPGAPNNPFPDNFQFRNLALIVTYWQTGLRRSDVLSLRCEDLSDRSDEPAITLRRRPNDQDELRSRPPSIKTMPRTVPITPITHSILWDYYTRHRRLVEVELKSRGDRAALRRFKSNPYLFVSANGSALSASSVYKIFDTLRMQTDGLPVYLSPHTLRRTWNDLFIELGGEDAFGERGIRLREFLMGWVTGSRQSARYARQAIQGEAGRAIIEMQQKWMKRWEMSHDE